MVGRKTNGSFLDPFYCRRQCSKDKATTSLQNSPTMKLKNFIDMIISKTVRPRLASRSSHSWISTANFQISLDAAGLVALADLSTIANRTALTGTSALLDSFILCPGIQRQQTASELNRGEYPVVAAMTSGYVFRVENPATVYYLQKIGLTGHLTTVSVQNATQLRCRQMLAVFYSFENATLLTTIIYLTAISVTMVTLIFFCLSKDWWGLFVVILLVFARMSNIVIIRRRSQEGWKGASEPGEQGDLLILLSQDRWVRMRGAVDDLKAVTSGQWLRDMTFMESSIAALSTVLVYLDAALASNVNQSGQVSLLMLLICSSGLLAIVNEKTDALQMHGRILKVEGQRKRYVRRLDMVKQLVEESGREDWAIRMGAVVPPPGEKGFTEAAKI